MRQVEKTKRFVIRVLKDFRSDMHFSLLYAGLRVVEVVGRKMRLNVTADAARDKRNRWISQYLAQLLAPVLQEYENDADIGTASLDGPVWICWWTGLDTAPKLIRRCVQSVVSMAGDHPVNIITKENYKEFLIIPTYMIEKVDRGEMGLAHLADYIRVKLLAEHGGLWLDATIFCSQSIPELCFELPLFSCKGPVRKSGYISDYRWTTFCLGGWKGSVFYRFLVRAFECYWETQNRAIDYLFFDHLILLAYEHLSVTRDLLDAIPDNNVHRDDLQAAMNDRRPASMFEHIVHPDTALYKLSWRETYSETTEQNEDSVYKFFIDNCL